MAQPNYKASEQCFLDVKNKPEQFRHILATLGGEQHGIRMAVESSLKWGNHPVVLSDVNLSFPECEFHIVPKSAGLDKLKNVFQNRGPNGSGFEMACIQRWVAVSWYVNTHVKGPVFASDNDVLVFCNLHDERVGTYDSCDFTRSDGISLGQSFWNKPSALSEFVDFIYEFYEQGHILKGDWVPAQDNVNDMTLGIAFAREKHAPVMETSVVRNGSVFDHHMSYDLEH